MYYREGCHLCEQMTASLRLLQRELTFEIELIDIDRDDVLRKRYDVDVPVVACNGEVICYHFFEEDMVRKSIETRNNT
ncbi:MAG: glutaredoxin family protein [Thiolinea sp.]